MTCGTTQMCPAADGREQMVPYWQLDDDLKELDRVTVRSVLASIERAGFKVVPA